MRHAIAGGLLLAASLAPIGASLVQEGASAPVAPLTAARFKAITQADLEKMPSGCSFATNRGKDLVAIMVDEDYQSSGARTGKPSFCFKIDGKLTQTRGEAKKNPKNQNLGVWTGVVDGRELRLVEGRVDPKFKNDGGAGRLEWKDADGVKGSTPIRWEAGC